jgi:hypothetical protein
LFLQLLQTTNENVSFFNEILFFLNFFSFQEQNFDEIVKFCTQAKDVLKIIETTHDLGTKPNLVENGKTSKRFFYSFYIKLLILILIKLKNIQ